ncbi:MAG: mechanosensitive ion channel family protein [Sphingomonadales bacterium]|nr:mechanosensitive ion channel family protein [Sphingomonadales bacterium]PIX65517.1 MAG: mechanosensitive ion channel protein MscS [Sphingomonadales bacterium CG_4_10_14_3_um_filter_58_15]NCO49261.1 mechanosensitive ion channel family protein [Sphingomonadales bacterium]NCP01240.1 mechanosensitive ion channel family protein [Sphingomonadales bacterium]NCP26664.1 mechanosensitive ion channel family protein [Sphingomonadales bacterium]
MPDIGASIQRLTVDGSQWLTTHYVELIFAAVIGTAIFFALGAIKRLGARYVRNNHGLTGYRTIIGTAIARTSKFFMLMVSAELVVNFASAPSSFDRVVHVLFTISVVIQVAIWLREVILGLIVRRTSRDPDQHETLENAMTLIRLLVTFVLFAIAAIMILDNLGVDVTGLIAGLGVGGIAIGLAAQGIFSDLFAALSIIFDKPFRRGETISYDNTVGTIEKIGLKSTRLRAITGEEIIISNTNLLDKEIVNMTRLARRRTRFGIGVIYQTQPGEARRIPALLKKIVEDNDAVFVRCGFVGFGDSSINFELDFDIMSSDYDVVYQGRHIIGLAILQAFNEEGLEFAYPTQTTFTAAPDGEMILPYPEGGFGTVVSKD